MSATAIILAGGKSSRMGTNKALLPVNGKTNIEIIKEQLTPYFSELLLVANDFQTYDFLGIPIVKDEFLGKGPLAGIHTGLKNSKTEVNFFVACDMPFVSGKLANYLVHAVEDYEGVVPNINGTLHPLFSVFKRSVLPTVEQCLLEDRLRIRDLLGDINVRFVSEMELKRVIVGNIEKIFYNMNYPSDYQKVNSWPNG